MTPICRHTTARASAIATVEPTTKRARPHRRASDLISTTASFHGLKDISLDFHDRQVTALIGPSGCGKSTLLRTFNRIYSLYPEQRAEGADPARRAEHPVPSVDVNELRARVGMVFQKPTPFPMSIYDNIAFGIRLYEKLPQSRARQPGRGSPAQGGPVGRGEGQAAPIRHGPVRRPAAAPLHRPHHRAAPGGDPVRRADLGARPDLHRQDRGADRAAALRVHAS